MNAKAKTAGETARRTTTTVGSSFLSAVMGGGGHENKLWSDAWSAMVYLDAIMNCGRPPDVPELTEIFRRKTILKMLVEEAEKFYDRSLQSMLNASRGVQEDDIM